MQTLKLLAVSSLKTKDGSKNGDNKAKFPAIRKSCKWGRRASTVLSLLISTMKFISQTFKYASVRHHITITNKDACFSESWGKACGRGLCDERCRAPGARMLPSSRAMAGEGMTICSWGTARASGWPHTSRSRMLDSGSTPGDTKPVRYTSLPEVRAGVQGAVAAPEAGGCCGWGGKWDRKAGLVLRAEPDASSLRDVSPGWPWGWHTGFILHCRVKLFSRSMQLLWQPSAARPWEEGRKMCRRSLFYYLFSYLLN